MTEDSGVKALVVSTIIISTFCRANCSNPFIPRKHQKSRVAEKESHIEDNINTSKEADSEEGSVEFETGTSFYYSNPAYVDEVGNEGHCLEEYKNPAYIDDLEDF